MPIGAFIYSYYFLTRLQAKVLLLELLNKASELAAQQAAEPKAPDTQRFDGWQVGKSKVFLKYWHLNVYGNFDIFLGTDSDVLPTTPTRDSHGCVHAYWLRICACNSIGTTNPRRQALRAA